jgi:hypothetical protein
MNPPQVKNEFLLHLKSNDIEKLDQLFLELINEPEFDAELVSRKIFKQENKTAYRIKISAASLIKFKKKFDEVIDYDCLQLFEYKEW